jgi:hypothetical protein
MRASKPAADQPDDLFEMANLSPALTGLPMWSGSLSGGVPVTTYG